MLLHTHRLVQDKFCIWLGPQRSFETWKLASELLFKVFPKHFNGLSLRKEWHVCRRYIRHVLVLCTRFRETPPGKPSPHDLDTFIELLTSCGWLVDCLFLYL
jgi:hypothetical protein